MNSPKIHSSLDFAQQTHLLIYFHVVFTLLNAVILFLPWGIPIGVKIFVLVLIYHLSLPMIAQIYQAADVLALWRFLLPLSVWMVFPDWFLSAQLKILVFPPDGFYKIGTVSAYMAGLWVIPLLLSTYAGLWAKKHYSEVAAYGASGGVALLIFGISEENMWLLSSWYPQNVWIISHTAVYVLIPELILGLTTYWFFQATRSLSMVYQIIATYLVMLIYTGALMFFYFFVG
ncbi:MAG: hypothetical protein MUE85_09345 [Microscillaceae bacterium]|jgi:hypothetical protein|nr:hypothetical protein [Microscillaceae bacterium]